MNDLRSQPGRYVMDVRIRNIAAGGSGFGITPEGQTVFIPRTVVNRFRMAVGDLYPMEVKDNASAHDDHTSQLFCTWVFADPPDQGVPETGAAPAPQPEVELDPTNTKALTDAVWGVVNDEGFWSARAVADKLFSAPSPARTIAVADALKRLSVEGELQYIAVKNKHTQQKASAVYWCADFDKIHKLLGGQPGGEE